MRLFAPSFLASVLVCVSSTRAQAPCDAWGPQFAPAGPDAAFRDFAAFDAGTGAALYAAGPFRAIGAQSIQGVARWDGASWSAVGGGVPGAVELAVFDDGSGPALYAAGDFSVFGGAPANTVARWNGASWAPLAGAGAGPTGATSVVEDLAVLDDGSGARLYVVGRVSLPGGGPSARVVRWDGANWTRQDSGIVSGEQASAIAAFDDGSGPALYLGGSTNNGLGAVKRWNGAAWISVWPAATGGRVYALATFASGGTTHLYAAGAEFGVGPTADAILRYDGTSWSRVGGGLDRPGGFATARALVVHDDGQGPRLHVGGFFESAGGTPASCVASWDGATWRGVASGVDSTGAAVIGALGSFDDGGGAALFASGEFSRAGRTPTGKAARWRNGAWSGLADGEGVSHPVQSLHARVEGGARVLYASGNFDAAGSTLARGFARWDGGAWSAVGDPVDTNGFAYDFLDADLGPGTRLYAGGTFTRIGGVGAASIASWDGTAWSPLGAGTDGFVECLALYDDGHGPAVYAGGQFTTAGGAAASNVARWDGASWSPLGAGTDFQVHDLIAHDDGGGTALYACGLFRHAGGQPIERVARWNGTNWSAVGAEIVTGSGQMVRFAEFDDGTGTALYCSGQAFLPGDRYFRLVRWDGVAWGGVTTPEDLPIGLLTVFHDGTDLRLCTAGDAPGGSTEARIWGYDGAQWTTLAGGFDGGVSALVAFDLESDGVPDLYAGGGFRSAGGRPASNLARFGSCGTQGELECAGDGSFVACPCGNSGALGHGCASSVHAGGAGLSSDGIASLGSDTLALTARDLTGGSAIFAQGTTVAGGAGLPFDDGLLCAGGSVVRLGSAGVVGGAASVPSPGGARLSLLGGIATPGQTRIYQAVYRNSAAFCTSGTANATNGLRITWSP